MSTHNRSRTFKCLKNFCFDYFYTIIDEIFIGATTVDVHPWCSQSQIQNKKNSIRLTNKRAISSSKDNGVDVV